MDAKFQEVRDRRYRNKLACIYCPEAGVVEIKLFGCRLLRIRFPPDTPVEFIFSDSESAA